MKLNILLMSAAVPVNAATATKDAVVIGNAEDYTILANTDISTVSDSAAAIAPVDLGTAGDYVILTKTGISTVPASLITGDIAVSPIAGTAMTGFGMNTDSEGEFSTASQCTGKAYAADYSAPTPTLLTTAVSNMETKEERKE
jgi:hypothetical protein